MHAPDLATAIDHHQAGRLRAAEAIYQQLLARDPNHVDALHMLGVLAKQQGRVQQAIELIERAAQLAGPHPIVLFNLGHAHLERNDAQAALAAFRRAVAMQPSFGQAHVACGQALEQLGELSDAERSYRLAIEARPSLVEAHSRLGALVARLGRCLEAAECYRRAVRLEPRDFQLHNNLGAAFQESGHLEEATVAFEEAARLAPDCVAPLVNLASAWKQRRDYARAAFWYEQAARVEPNSALVYKLMADTDLDFGEAERGREHLERAVTLAPEQTLWKLRLSTLPPACMTSNAQIDAYRAGLVDRLRGARGQLKSFTVDELVSSGCKPPVDLVYQGRNDLEVKSLFADILLERIEPLPAVPRAGKPKVGFVVTGAGAGVFQRGMAGVLRHLDKRRLALVLAAPMAAEQELREAVADPELEFLPLPQSLSAAVEQLRAAACDVLYYWETGTDCLNYYLPFFRPAPVQCTSWGWPVTSGNPRIDCFLSSKLLEPAGAESHYREKLVPLDRLPNYYARPASALAPSPATREHYNLFAHQHVYLCNQNLRKIHPDFDALAAEILRRDSRGVLLLIEGYRAHLTNLLRERLAAAMPDCMDRVRFVPRMIRGDYLALASAADVVLDTIHYGGGANSIYDALWAGTPVVTLPGQFHRGHYAAAAYKLMGMPDCVADSPERYVSIALRLTGDAELRREVSARIAATRDVLFDDLAAVRELEEFFIGAAAAARS